jgi:hypothetical protein
MENILVHCGNPDCVYDDSHIKHISNGIILLIIKSIEDIEIFKHRADLNFYTLAIYNEACKVCSKIAGDCISGASAITCSVTNINYLNGCDLHDTCEQAFNSNYVKKYGYFALTNMSIHTFDYSHDYRVRIDDEDLINRIKPRSVIEVHNKAHNRFLPIENEILKNGFILEKIGEYGHCRFYMVAEPSKTKPAMKL